MKFTINYEVPAKDKVERIEAKDFEQAAVVFHKKHPKIGECGICDSKDIDNERIVIGFCEFCECPVFVGDDHAYDPEAGMIFCEDCMGKAEE